MSEFDARTLVRWLGPQGAKAGLEKSKYFTTEVLLKLGDRLALNLPKSATRQQMIDDIVKAANKRIEKPLDELVRMTREQLITYFERVGADREELLDLLKEIDAHPSKDGRRTLIEFAARELSETGRFMRIASVGGPLPPSEASAPARRDVRQDEGAVLGGRDVRSNEGSASGRENEHSRKKAEGPR